MNNELQVILHECSFTFGRGAIHFGATSESMVDEFRGSNGANIRVKWFELGTNTQ